MKFLRQQYLNRRAVNDRRLYVDANNSIVMETPSSLVLPKGFGDSAYPPGGVLDTDNQRPVSPVNGMIRYNTSTDEVEVYQSSSWRALRFKESTKIIQQPLSTIDGYSYFYGPLDASYDPTAVSSNNNNFGGQNILVFIENVFQVFNTNYTVTHNPQATVATSADAFTNDTTLTFTSTAAIPTGSLAAGPGGLQGSTTATVTNTHTVTLNKPLTGNIPSGTNVTFIAPTGYYLNFTSDAYYLSMVGKPITVLHGFDK
jgi:hypothetical protein